MKKYILRLIILLAFTGAFYIKIVNQLVFALLASLITNIRKILNTISCSGHIRTYIIPNIIVKRNAADAVLVPAYVPKAPLRCRRMPLRTKTACGRHYRWRLLGRSEI